MAVLGIDGCPGGWVAAAVDGQDVNWHVGTFAELLTLEAGAVAVDIPIGLPTGAARRAADVQARTALGRGRSSVFFAPPRVVLEAVDQPDATRLSRAAGSTGVSIQMFHVLVKVAEVDEVLRSNAAAAARVVEVHPEVSFRRLARTGELPSKRTGSGREARLAALRTWLPALELPGRLPGRARTDDCLDALACAWTAQRWSRGEADVLGDEVDGLGVPMRIVV
jgi:predicted RNase H-like nuclease